MTSSHFCSPYIAHFRSANKHLYIVELNGTSSTKNIPSSMKPLVVGKGAVLHKKIKIKMTSYSVFSSLMM
jgi:hypothetical protein